MNKNNQRFVAHFDMLGMEAAVRRNSEEAWGALSDIRAAKAEIGRRAIEVPAMRKTIIG